MSSKFDGLVITTTGYLGEKHDNSSLRRWVENMRGKWVSKMNQEVTHLICSKDHWIKQVPAVKMALDIKAKVVTYDWLEDSCILKSKKPENPYLWNTLEEGGSKKRKKSSAEEKARKKLKKVASNFKKGCQMAQQDMHSGTLKSRSTLLQDQAGQEDSSGCDESDAEHRNPGNEMRRESSLANNAEPSSSSSNSNNNNNNGTGTNSNCKGFVGNEEDPALAPLTNQQRRQKQADRDWKFPDNHHLYSDSTGFEYNVMLIRIDVRRNLNERFQLRLYESNEQPNTYATFVRHSRPQRVPIAQSVAPLGSSFEAAFHGFQKKFAEKTRYEWKDRKSHMWSTPTYLATDEDGQGGGAQQEEKPFVYKGPLRGKPIGIVPNEAELQVE